jgi:3-hydroxyacyl-CoA dehydrogenase
MRIAKLGVVGAGTMGSGIAALAASAGIPVVLLDIPVPRRPERPARAGLERARKARPAAFMDVARAGLITLGNLDDSLELLATATSCSRRSSSSPRRNRRSTRGSSRCSSPKPIVASNTSGSR